MPDLPSFSVIVTNMNGKHHLQECFSSLMELDYPRELIEYIMFDNDSHDGSIEYVEEHFQNVKVLSSPTNLGAVGAYNTAAKEAKNDILVFLNNDTKVDRSWMKESADALKGDVAAVATKTLNYYDQDMIICMAGRICTKRNPDTLPMDVPQRLQLKRKPSGQSAALTIAILFMKMK